MKKKTVKLDQKQLRGLINETFQKITAEELTAWKTGDYSSVVPDEKQINESSDMGLTIRTWADDIRKWINTMEPRVELGGRELDKLYDIVDEMDKMSSDWATTSKISSPFKRPGKPAWR